MFPALSLASTALSLAVWVASEVPCLASSNFFCAADPVSPAFCLVASPIPSACCWACPVFSAPRFLVSSAFWAAVSLVESQLDWLEAILANADDR
ncbi:hypothetical protein Mapa_002057 [Marchantia paleacea]|nr:hypothetical protein Mapa_002057 [Marchantia paleacea]